MTKLPVNLKIWSGGGKYEVNAIFVGYLMYVMIATPSL